MTSHLASACTDAVHSHSCLSPVAPPTASWTLIIAHLLYVCTSRYVGGSREPFLDRAFPLEPLEVQRGERRELGTGEGEYSDVYKVIASVPEVLSVRVQII